MLSDHNLCLIDHSFENFTQSMAVIPIFTLTESTHDINSDTYLYKVQTWQWHQYLPLQSPGPRLNIKTVLSTYGDFHVKDKTAVRTSYL